MYFTKFLLVVSVVVICTFIHIGIFDKLFPQLKKFKEYRYLNHLLKLTSVLPMAIVGSVYAHIFMSKDSVWYVIISTYSNWLLAVGLASVMVLLKIDSTEKSNKDV